MVYAQIKNGVVLNCIKLDDAGLEATFTVGFDSLIRIDTINPRPGIGWTYDGVDFTAPVGE